MIQSAVALIPAGGERSGLYQKDTRWKILLSIVAGRTSFNCLLLFSLANIAERRVRPYVCVIV